MNIQTVAENLRNTIAGKEKMLAECNSALAKELKSAPLRLTLITEAEILTINIGELKRILQDVEQCIPAETDSKRDLMKGLWKV
jgi:hypothetical protein